MRVCMRMFAGSADSPRCEFFWRCVGWLPSAATVLQRCSGLDTDYQQPMHVRPLRVHKLHLQSLLAPYYLSPMNIVFS